MYYYIIFTNQLEVSTTHLQQFRMADTLIPRMEIVAVSFNCCALYTATAQVSPPFTSFYVLLTTYVPCVNGQQ